MLTSHEIMDYQQNRYPMLFLDVVTEIMPGVSAFGFKNFSYNEWFFPAHFETDPNVPGFILSEAMSQIFLMTILTIKGNKGKKAASVKISNIIFKKRVIPGDRLYLEAKTIFYKRGIGRGHVVGIVNNEIVCQQDVEIVIPDVLKSFQVLQEE
jgi:3-hydroxyacyl-[acyl-carrier-protein] dehydratase